MLVTDHVVRAVGRRVQVHLRPPLHDHLPADAWQQGNRVGVGIDAEVVRERLERRLRLAHRDGGRCTDPVTRDAQHRGAIAQADQLATAVQCRDRRIGHPGLHIGQRKLHILLVLEITAQLHQPLVTGTDLRHPEIKIDAHQPCIAHIDAQCGRRGLRETVVGIDGHRRGTRKTGIGREVQRASVAPHAHCAVRGADDSDIERIAFGIRDQAVEVPVDVEIDVGPAHRRIDHGAGIGRITQRREQQLRVAGPQRSVTVEVCGPVVSTSATQFGQQGSVSRIDLRIAVHVTGNEQLERVLPGTAAANTQQVERRAIDAIERERTSILDTTRDRGVPQQLGQRRVEGRSVRCRHDHTEQHGTTGRQQNLAVTCCETVEMLFTCSERGSARRGQIPQCSTQVGFDRCHLDRIAVGDRLTHHRTGGKRQPMRRRLRVPVAQRARRLEVAYRTQVAVDVIAVQEGAPVRCRQLAQCTPRVAHPAQRLVPRTGDPRVTDGEVHAVVEHDAGDAASSVDLVARAIGPEQPVLCTFANEGCRIVGLAGLQIVEAVGAALQLACERAQLPATRRIIRHPGGSPVHETASLALLRREGEAEPLAIGSGQEQACPDAQRVVDTARLRAGGRHVDLQCHIAQRE